MEADDILSELYADNLAEECNDEEYETENSGQFSPHG
jgi:hypothetical protein